MSKSKLHRWHDRWHLGHEYTGIGVRCELHNTYVNLYSFFLQACIEKQAVFFPFVEVETVRLSTWQKVINILTWLKFSKIMRT